MAIGIVNLAISFETLVEAVKGLAIEDKLKLWDALDEQIAEYQEQHPQFRAEVEQVLAEYEAGDYITIEEYIAQ